MRRQEIKALSTYRSKVRQNLSLQTNISTTVGK